MAEFWTSANREFIYLCYYFELQFQQIFRYWVIGILIGSCISVFLKDRIHGLFRQMSGSKFGVLGLVPASLLGIASPLCMYGTIPLAASVSRSGMRDDWLAAFMMTSILLNPQLIIYSVALGPEALTVRIISCFLCGIAAGLFVRLFFRNKEFFDFRSFDEPKNRDTDPDIPLRLAKNIGRNIRATGPMFLLGCGGGTIPLLQGWLAEGMSLGSAAAFMITGPATKITNLGALKIATGWKRFALYIAFVLAASFLSGIAVNILI